MTPPRPGSVLFLANLDGYEAQAVCSLCGQPSSVQLTPDQAVRAARWLTGKGGAIQDLLPDLTPPQREIIMTGIHPDCWERLAPPEED